MVLFLKKGNKITDGLESHFLRYLRYLGIGLAKELFRFDESFFRNEIHNAESCNLIETMA